MSTLLLVLLGTTVAVGAFAQRTTGIGFTLLVGPACAMALQPDAALGTAVRLAIVADLAVLIAQRTGLTWREVGAYLWPALAAFPLALGAVRVVPADVLLVTAACATIVAALALVPRGTPMTTDPNGQDDRPAFDARAAGFAAGFLGITTGMAGPPLALHATLTRRPLAASRATMTAFFLVIDAAAIIAHPTAASTATTAVLVVALLTGTVVGGLAVDRIREISLRRAIPPLVIAGACTALVRVLG